MKLKENYVGSIAILLVGCLYFALELYGVESEHTLGGILSGTGIILAAIAYRSAKRRRIYISEPTTFRIGLESVLILTSVFLLFMFSVGDVMFFTYQPLTSIVWLGIIAAYIFMVFGSRTNDVITYKKPNNKEETKSERTLGREATEFYGSSVAVFLGILYFGSGVNAIAQNTGGSTNGLFLGPAIILGALAYKSAKKRKLNIVTTSKIRMALEVIAILLVLASVVLMRNDDIRRFIAEEPVSFLLWLWALIPYFIMVFGSRKKNTIADKIKDKEVNENAYQPVLDTGSKFHLEGLGGWLMLLGFSIVVSPLRMLVDFVRDYSLYSDSILIVLNSEQVTTVFSGGEPAILFWLLIFEFVGSAIFLLLGIYVAYLFFTKKVNFPNVFVNVALWFLLWNLIDVYASSTLSILEGSVGPEVYKLLAGQVFYIVVWIWYINKSVRVKNTFIN
jgi:hypothetical protein